MTKRKAPQFFNPDASTDYLRGGNDGYLAALLDRAHIQIWRSKRDGKALRVVISMGRSKAEARKTFAFIDSHYGVKGTVTPINLKNAPSVRRRGRIGEPTNYNTANYYKLTNPEDALRLAKSAGIFSEAPERLGELVLACEEILARRGAN